MRVQANGFVFCNDKGLTIKASSVSRGFSKHKLESKLVAFTPAAFDGETQKKNVYRYEPLNKNMIGAALYDRYQHDMTHGKAALSTKLKHLREAKFRLIEKTKKRARIKRNALKLMSVSTAPNAFSLTDFEHVDSITFADPDMEAQRQKLILEQEKNNEQSRRYQFHDGRRASGSHQVTEAAARREKPTKTNALNIRQDQSAEGQNSLRDVSQLDVVQLTGRNEVLLQNHAHDKLERQRRQPDNHVRRKIFGLKKQGKAH